MDTRRVVLAIGMDIGMNPVKSSLLLYEGRKFVAGRSWNPGPFDTAPDVVRDLEELASRLMVELEWWA